MRSTLVMIGAAVILAALVANRVSAAPNDAADVGDALQVLADLTLIDADCQTASVNFGIGFQVAANEGLSASSVMPTGERRQAFERALDHTRQTLDPDTICGALAQHYAITVPGSVLLSADTRTPHL